jgi:hypothetical protein
MLPSPKTDEERTPKDLDEESYLSVHSYRRKETGRKTQIRNKLPQMRWILVGVLAFVVFIIILIANGSGDGDWEGALKKAIQGERQ